MSAPRQSDAEWESTLYFETSKGALERDRALCAEVRRARASEEALAVALLSCRQYALQFASMTTNTNSEMEALAAARYALTALRLAGAVP